MVQWPSWSVKVAGRDGSSGWTSCPIQFPHRRAGDRTRFPRAAGSALPERGLAGFPCAVTSLAGPGQGRPSKVLKVSLETHLPNRGCSKLASAVYSNVITSDLTRRGLAELRYLHRLVDDVSSGAFGRVAVMPGRSAWLCPTLPRTRPRGCYRSLRVSIIIQRPTRGGSSGGRAAEPSPATWR